ncbi:F-box and associated interaction domains-containing protein [Striga asiatica]|uniref:F-box and associated interaction domains-containing protein n=1 Tax=Striga asiatica TaxID=4170 RepID=A0A5A7Q1F0_STRAF|nr:F-box and associated interaction domains-containing protein [Striga asiatica]
MRAARAGRPAQAIERARPLRQTQKERIQMGRGGQPTKSWLTDSASASRRISFNKKESPSPETVEDVTPVSEDREAPIPQDKAVSPWKTGVHQRSTEETRPSQQEIGSEDRTRILLSLSFFLNSSYSKIHPLSLTEPRNRYSPSLTRDAERHILKRKRTLESASQLYRAFAPLALIGGWKYQGASGGIVYKRTASFRSDLFKKLKGWEVRRPVHQVLPLQGPVAILPLLKSSKGQDPRLLKCGFGLSLRSGGHTRVWLRMGCRGSPTLHHNRGRRSNRSLGEVVIMTAEVVVMEADS